MHFYVDGNFSYHQKMRVPIVLKKSVSTHKHTWEHKTTLSISFVIQKNTDTYIEPSTYKL